MPFLKAMKNLPDAFLRHYCKAYANFKVKDYAQAERELLLAKAAVGKGAGAPPNGYKPAAKSKSGHAAFAQKKSHRSSGNPV